MKRSILRALALCLAMTVAVTCARAQATGGTSPGTGAGTGTGPGTRSPQGAPPTSSGTYSPGTQPSPSSSATAAGQSVRLSKLMNTTLKGQTGESLGIVQDLIADPTSGQLQFVVLSLSSSAAGAPGAGAATTRSTDPSVSSPRSAPSGVGSYGTITGGGQLVAIPWRLVSAGAGDQFSAMVDRAKLESAPKFSATAWPTMDSAWMQKVYSHFGVDATGTGTGAPGTGTGTGTGTINPSTPGLPSTPGTPDITPPPNANPSTTPGTLPRTTPGTTPGTSPSGAPEAK